MSKTADLRKLIKSLLDQTEGKTYHRKAADDAVMPYKVYSLQRIGLGDPARDDNDLCVDLWGRDEDIKAVEEIADHLEDLFNTVNLPQDTILPTFFRDSRYPVEDADKSLVHLQLHFTIQNYVKG